MYNRVALGARIKVVRQKRGETQTEFGKKFLPPVSKVAVSKWERGITKPTAQRLREIAKLGNVTVEFLINGDNTTAEEAQKLLNNVISRSRSTNEEDKKRLYGIQLELRQQLKSHDDAEKIAGVNKKTHLLNDLESEIHVLDEDLDYSSLVTFDQFFKLFNFLSSIKNPSILKEFNEILWHINQIAEGNEIYDKERDLLKIDNFLTKLSMSN